MAEFYDKLCSQLPEIVCETQAIDILTFCKREPINKEEKEALQKHLWKNQEIYGRLIV